MTSARVVARQDGSSSLPQLPDSLQMIDGLVCPTLLHELSPDVQSLNPIWKIGTPACVPLKRDFVGQARLYSVLVYDS